ncbi:MAG TPA: hypothetical protein VMD59_03170 [Acidimicrobiales bacterium]|nr:hypothetical protein [Acidimicrobiales bacterium]
MAYFDVSGDRTALLPACSVCVFAGVLAAMLAHYERPARRAVALVTVWVGLVLATYPLFGRVGLGTLLTAAFAVQVAPSIWSAYRTSDPSAISSGTWLLILAELACWAFYGAARSDPRLLALGITGVAASLSILGRAAMTWRSP